MNNAEAALLLQRQINRLREQLGAAEHRYKAEVADMWQRLHALEESLEALIRKEAGHVPVPTPETEELPVEEMPPVPHFEETVVPPPIPPPYPAVMVQASAPARPEVAPVPPAAPPEDGSFELQFGRVWLVRLGIGLLVTGLVLLGNYAYKNWIRDLPPGARLAALYVGSMLLSGGGVYLARRENLRRFGEVLIAGGLAFFYWCTFAAHHVPRLRVVESPVVAGMLLLGAAGVIVAVSLRRGSKATAVMGLLLASYSTMLQPLGWLSAASNVVLAAMGTVLLLRPRWVIPGIAAMAGTYGAFFWWQIAGAIGSRPEDPAALWFLPPVWMMFALPGVIGVSKHFAGLSERAQAGFATANNASFFLLFSLVWQEQQGNGNYWLVPAVFGAVLISLGIIGRGKDQAGGFHLAQGMAALTLAIVLKLEGFHLALALAGQSLGLALAFVRFRGKSELTFATVAALGATGLILDAELNGVPLPTWSCGLTALVLTAAAFPLRRGCDHFEAAAPLGKIARAAVSVVFLAGGTVALAGWCGNLAPVWRAPAAATIALGMTAFTLLRDKGRSLEEAAFAALAFHIATGGFLLLPDRELLAWGPAVVALIGLGAHWLWVRNPVAAAKSGFDLAGRPEIFLWLTGLTVTAGLYRAGALLNLSPLWTMLSCGAAAIAVAALARFVLRSPVLAIAGAFLLPRAVTAQLEPSTIPWITEFLPLLAALVVVAIALVPEDRKLFRDAGIVARCCAFASWFSAWNELAPDGGGDILAASGVALLAVSARFKRSLPETWVLLGLGVIRLTVRSAELGWDAMDAPPFSHGWLVVLSGMAAGFLMRRQMPKGVSSWLFYLASALLALWSSQLVVWHFDWEPVAVLWTGLGFLLVSAGLWQKAAALRHSGFALLAMALAKLFVRDVWDFNTFNRVAAFLALGVALVVLGFFYNRFADVLKKLFEGDEA